jgi:hypothetical protein
MGLIGEKKWVIFEKSVYLHTSITYKMRAVNSSISKKDFFISFNNSKESKALLTYLESLNFVTIRPIQSDTEPEILQEFRMALENVKDFKSGKKKSKTLEEILNGN